MDSLNLGISFGEICYGMSSCIPAAPSIAVEHFLFRRVKDVTFLSDKSAGWKLWSMRTQGAFFAHNNNRDSLQTLVYKSM